MMFLVQVPTMLDFKSNSVDNFATGLIPSTTNSDPLTARNSSPLALAMNSDPLTAINSAPLALAVNSTPLPEPKTTAPITIAAADTIKDPLTGAGLGLLAEYYADITFTNLKKLR
jgi:hypothetical protein